MIATAVLHNVKREGNKAVHLSDKLKHGDTMTRANKILQKVREKQELAFKLEQEQAAQGQPIKEPYQSEDSIEQKIAPPYMIHPEHEVKVYWDLLIGGFILYSVILIPFRLAFGAEQSELLWLDITGDILFGFDIIASFRTGYYDEDLRLIFNKGQVSKHYLKSWFLIDFLSTFPFDVILAALLSGVSKSSLRSMKIIRSVRLVRLVKLFRVLKLSKQSGEGTNSDFRRSWKRVLSLLQLTSVISFIAHLMSCLWYYIAVNSEYEENWINYVGLNANDTLARNYTVSLYWTFTTMTTVGYGDIFPINDGEMVVGIVTMMIGATVFGYIIGNVSAMLDNLDAAEKIRKTKMDAAKTYLRTHKYSRAFRRRLTLHFDYYYRNKAAFDHGPIDKFLDPALKQEILVRAGTKIMKRFKVLKECDISLLAELLPKMHRFFVLEEESIFAQGHIACQVYFLLDGRVDLVREQAGQTQKICTVQKGEVFGDISVVCKQNRFCWAVSLNYSELYFVDQFDLVDLFDTWSLFGQKFKSQAENKLIEYRKVLKEATGIDDGDITQKKPSYFLESDSEESTLRRRSVSREDNEGIFRKICVHPDATHKRAWDGLIGVFIIYSVITVPYFIGFDVDPVGTPLILNLITDILFWLDIAITFLTLIHDERHRLVYDPKIIALTYLNSGWLIIDFASTFDFYAVVSASSTSGSAASGLKATKMLKMFRLIRLFKLMRLLKLNKLLGKYEEYFDIPPAIMSVGNLCIQMLFFSHFMACVWYGVSDQSSDSWRFDYFCGVGDVCTNFATANVSNASSVNHSTQFSNALTNCLNNATHYQSLCFASISEERRYLTSAYWAFATMTTVGFGDVAPSKSSIQEMIVAIALEMVGTTIFAFVIGNLTTLIVNLDPVARALEKTQEEIINYCKQTETPNQLTTRAVNQLQHYFRLKSIFDEQEIETVLPTFLRIRKITGINLLRYQTFGIFHDMENRFPGFMSLIIQELKPLQIGDGELVIKAGRISQEMFFVDEGTITVTSVGDNKEITEYTRGNCCNQVTMILPASMHFQIMVNAKAKGKSRLFELHRRVMPVLRYASPSAALAFEQLLMKDPHISEWIAPSFHKTKNDGENVVDVIRKNLEKAEPFTFDCLSDTLPEIDHDEVDGTKFGYGFLMDEIAKRTELPGQHRLEGVISSRKYIPPPEKLKETVKLVAKTILTDFLLTQDGQKSKSQKKNSFLTKKPSLGGIGLALLKKGSKSNSKIEPNEENEK